MSAPLVDFESENVLKAKRDEKRKKRGIILQKAKEDYEKRERRKELRKQRGDDTWMLPSVNLRLEAEEEKPKSKKHKKEKKKKKKHKKEKKHKHKSKDGRQQSSSSDEDSDSDEWVEKGTEEPAVPAKPTKQYSAMLPPPGYLGEKPDVQTQDEEEEKDVASSPPGNHDDWMASPFMSATFSRDDIRKEKEAERETEKEKNAKLLLDNPGQSARELNPFWKDGGTGLPEENPSKKKPPQVKAGIGDGGAGWLRKSYKRVVEMAEEQGRSIEALAAERWGSLEKYYELLAEAEGTSGHSRNRRSWKNDSDSSFNRNRERQGERSYGRDGSRDWKGQRDDDRGHGSTSRERGSDRDRYQSRDYDRYRDSGRDKDDRGNDGERSKYRNQDRGRDGDRYQERDQGGRDSTRSYSDRDSGRYGSRESTEPSSSSSRRTFMRPSDSGDRPSSAISSFGDLKGKFKKPGDDDAASKDQRISSSSRGSSSSSVGAMPSWKKAFKKPGELSDNKDTSAGSSRTSSSSAAPAWKKSDSKTSESRQDDRSHSRKGHSSSSDSSSGSSSSSSSEDDNEIDRRRKRSPTPPPPPVILSESEMNQLGAKIVKAEIMGNEALAQKLKSKLEAARQAKASQPARTMVQQGQGRSDRPKRNTREGREEKEGASSEDDDVVLTRMDRSGQSWPLPERTVPAEQQTGRRKKKQKVATHGDKGQRERYFADDDELDLKTLVQQEKMSSAEDQQKLFSRMAAKSMEKLNTDYTLDDMFVSSAAKKESKAQTEERERSRAIAEHRRLAASLSKCPRCVDSPDMQKHLIIALGMKVYLSLPATKPLTDGHCLIIPMQHSIASTGLDEDVWNEIQVYRKGLTRMFEDQERDAIFLETCMNPKKQRHMCIECIPVPKESGDLAPIYFKKAIQDSESEWMQNKKVIDTRNKGIRKSVPPGFPYFSVDFGLDGGFAHVIEDEQLFPHYFGKEIIGGMLDVEPMLWRRPHKQNFEDQRKKVLQFADWWKPFDWTQKIER